MSGRKDTFTHEETIDRVVPGTGPVTISSWVYGIEKGDWNVEAELLRPTTATAAGAGAWKRSRAEPLSRAGWSWRRWRVSTVPATPVRTRWALPAPLARIPGVLPGSFTVLGSVAIFVALYVQSTILATSGVAIDRSLTASVLALLSGLVGAKLWSRVLHPGESLVGPGWAVDGFLVVAPLVAVGAVLAFGLPVGAYLDATAPGLFLAVAIGRLGCFFTGCCAGRPTRSRWSIWSSDRRVGARRTPTQLLESGIGLLIAGVTLLAVVSGAVPFVGAIFVAAIAGYFAARQVLLRLRAEPREFLWQRQRAPAPQRL